MPVVFKVAVTVALPKEVDDVIVGVEAYFVVSVTAIDCNCPVELRTGVSVLVPKEVEPSAAIVGVEP
tara:strand:- start:52 stop:252 length:201 start_codon:yes stop_codon:yes gene_type:complete